ncbi:MAG: PEP-CTERM sorting domain-containing protein [Verrucomicrobiota bacterium]|nr:PEP-CTERM sorting domain-containing protein [Verrucomicrobiota bacterium]
MNNTINRVIKGSVWAISLCLIVSNAHAVTTYFYGGDLQPSEGEYASWFTTVGPGNPADYGFGHTTWASDGAVLAMTTSITPSEGIWFGISNTGNYYDYANIFLANTSLGNNVTTRLALAPGSSQWSLYWYDASGSGAALYLEANGFTYYTSTAATFVPVADMNAYHTFGTHVYEGQVTYSFDGVLLAEGTAPYAPGAAGFLLFGDGSATDVSGYGTLLVDSLSISVEAGAPAIPEPATTAAFLAGAVMIIALLKNKGFRW